MCWLSYEHAGGDVRDRLVWHVWHDDALVVLAGADQPLAGLPECAHAEVGMRAKDGRGLLVRWRGQVAPVPPGTEQWEEHAAALLGVRLNLPDPAAALEEWRRSATIVRVTPVPDGLDAER